GLAATIANAGVSGDTASGGLSRLDWSVPDGTDAVILELGANDGLRGLDPKVTKAALDAILRKLADRRIVVLLAGMQAPRNLGPEYARDFDSIYPALASTHPVVFYPFFLEGVAADSKLNQADGLHPNAAGVDTIVARILPRAEELIVRASSARASLLEIWLCRVSSQVLRFLLMSDRRCRLCAADCPAPAGSIQKIVPCPCDSSGASMTTSHMRLRPCSDA